MRVVFILPSEVAENGETKAILCCHANVLIALGITRLSKLTIHLNYRARQIRFYPGCPLGNHILLLGCPTYDTGCPKIFDQKSYK